MLLCEGALYSVLRWSVAIADYWKRLTVFGTEFSASFGLEHGLKEAAAVFHPFFSFSPHMLEFPWTSMCEESVPAESLHFLL